jgi:hypothetical protein
MAEKEKLGNTKKKKINHELIDTSYDTEESSVSDLMKNGFTCEQATSWLRTKYLTKLFNAKG